VPDIKKRLQNDQDPIYTRLTADINAANVIGVSQTPTFIVEAPGITPRAFGYSTLEDALKGNPYAAILNAKT
jgi:hypothetical protein